MNKKGFTLVELLAVIAILAILVIIALPNVLNLYNDAKKGSFQTEVQTIYKTAQQEFLLGGKAVEYYRSGGNACSTNGTTLKSLSLQGTKSVDYYIKIDANGNVKEYYVADDAFAFSYKASDEDIALSVDEIGDDDHSIIVLADQTGETNLYATAKSTISGKCSAGTN